MNVCSSRADGDQEKGGQANWDNYLVDRFEILFIRCRMSSYAIVRCEIESIYRCKESISSLARHFPNKFDKHRMFYSKTLIKSIYTNAPPALNIFGLLSSSCKSRLAFFLLSVSLRFSFHIRTPLLSFFVS